MGNIGLQRELTKLYKPITESQSTITREIGALKESTSSALQALPASISSQLKAITPSIYPSIQAETAEEEAASRQKLGLIELGPLASSYLKRSVSNKQSTDRTFGLYEKDNTFFIGDKAVTIAGDDITFGTTKYRGTQGLWELIMLREPDDKLYDTDDLRKYKNILLEINALFIQGTNRVKFSGGAKYKNIIKSIYDELKSKKGEELLLPSDSDALVDILDLRLASYNAGNTGVRNKIVDIADELRRQSVLTDEQYKKLMLVLYKKCV